MPTVSYDPRTKMIPPVLEGFEKPGPNRVKLLEKYFISTTTPE